MSEELSEEIKRDLDKARELHDRAAADYTKCMEFNELLADVMDRLEDSGCTRKAGKIMGVLLDCNPKDGARCDTSTLVGDRLRKF